MADLAERAGPSRPLACPGVIVSANGLLIRTDHVVFAVLDRFTPQKVIKLIPTLVLIGPLSHGLEHIALDLNVIVSDGGVMERAEDVVNNFIDRNTCVLPGIEDAAGYLSVGTPCDVCGVK